MGSAMMVVVGHLTFMSKSAANQHFSAMLNRYNSGRRLSAADDADLRAILALHPDRDAKLAGQEVSHFEVRDFVYKKRSFFLIRMDGSAVDFSFQRSLSIRR
jgi:hypothetical protein